MEPTPSVCSPSGTYSPSSISSVSTIQWWNRRSSSTEGMIFSDEIVYFHGTLVVEEVRIYENLSVTKTYLLPHEMSHVVIWLLTPTKSSFLSSQFHTACLSHDLTSKHLFANETWSFGRTLCKTLPDIGIFIINSIKKNAFSVLCRFHSCSSFSMGTTVRGPSLVSVTQARHRIWFRFGCVGSGRIGVVRYEALPEVLDSKPVTRDSGGYMKYDWRFGVCVNFGPHTGFSGKMWYSRASLCREGMGLIFLSGPCLWLYLAGIEINFGPETPYVTQVSFTGIGVNSNQYSDTKTR